MTPTPVDNSTTFPELRFSAKYGADTRPYGATPGTSTSATLLLQRGVFAAPSHQPFHIWTFSAPKAAYIIPPPKTRRTADVAGVSKARKLRTNRLRDRKLPTVNELRNVIAFFRVYRRGAHTQQFYRRIRKLTNFLATWPVRVKLIPK